MTEIPDITDAELHTVHTTLEERYGEVIEPERADCELRLDSESSDLVLCPSLFWQKGDCNFVIFKLGPQRFRCQFFYGKHEMYGTGVEEFDNIGDCVLTLLQVQADHEAQRKGNFPEGG